MLTNGKRIMANCLRIALWNANGICHHKRAMKYKCYHTNHPDKTAHAGSAVLIRDSLAHYELQGYSEAYLQATTVKIKASPYDIVISAIYCPPRYNLKKDNFEGFFCTLGSKFIAGGDYNSKHVMWGSRVSTTRGRELAKLVKEKNYSVISTETPTYWPMDPQKIPDLLDFFIINGMSAYYIESIPNFDLSSDHTPVIATVTATILVDRESSPTRKFTKL